MSTIAKGRSNSKGKSRNGTAGKPAKAKRRRVRRERCIATIPLSEFPRTEGTGWRLYGDGERIHMDARSTCNSCLHDLLKNATSIALYIAPTGFGHEPSDYYLDIRFVGDNDRISAGIRAYRLWADSCKLYLKVKTPEEKVWHKRTEWLAVALPGAISDKILEVFTSRSKAAADEVAALTAAVLADEAKEEGGRAKAGADRAGRTNGKAKAAGRKAAASC